MRAASRSRNPKKFVRPPLASAAMSCCSAAWRASELGVTGGKSAKRGFRAQWSRKQARHNFVCRRGALQQRDHGFDYGH